MRIRNMIILAMLLLLINGCMTPAKIGDKVIEVDGGSKYDKAFSYTNGTRIEFQIQSASFAEKINAAGLNIETCNKTFAEAMVGPLQGETLNCADNPCKVESYSQKATTLYMNATCKAKIADYGKLYLVHLDISANISSNDLLALPVFRHCGESGCRASYVVMVEKSSNT